jgi:hypothetical protein
MEIFDIHRRDVYSFDDYMDLKKPGFGGPSSGKLLKDAKGKDVNPDRKLTEYQNTVKRHDQFSNQVYDPTYKAMGGDLVHKQDQGKNPNDYPDPYSNMGIPVVKVGDAANEGKCYTNFDSFVNESAKLDDTSEDCDDCDCEDKENCNCKDKAED